MKYISIRNDIRKSAATLMVANFVADSISNHFFTSAVIPMINAIKEINVNTLKSMIVGNKLVYGIRINDRVANNPEITLILKANSRPFNTIQVILLPNLSPSIVGISKLFIKIICKKITGIEKIKNGRSNVPINTK